MDNEKNNLSLIHTVDEFSMKIGGKEIPYVEEYTITANAGKTVKLSLTLKIPLEVINIETDNAKLL